MPGPGKTEVTHGDRKGRARHMQTIAYSRPMQYATLEVPVRKSALTHSASRPVRATQARPPVGSGSSGHGLWMPAPLFARKPERCPFGHSLARGKPQKISWMPCIYGPAQERARHGWGMGHVTLWCGVCSDQEHRDTVFYEPPHDLGLRPLNGWMTRPDA